MSAPLNPSQPFPAAPAEPPHAFLVGQDGEGRWVAVETHGLAGGIFRTRRDAIRYACAETGCRPDDVPLAVGPVPFRLS